MQKTNLRISIVIPAYNEENHIGLCLDAISKLKFKPFEVIVVDNMSTDNTAEIARGYPFVKIVKARKRGVVHARDVGFNRATGDIIGRIDVDTLLPADWTFKVNEIFKDKSVKAVSGGLHFYDIGLSRLIDGIDAYWRAWMAKRMAPTGRVFLWGSNMAIRRSTWDTVKGEVCHKNGFHEDLDLSLHLSSHKQKIVFNPALIANVSARRVDTSLVDLTKYAFESPWIYIKHNAQEHRYMYPLIAIVLVNYLLLRVLFRAFDAQAQKFKLKQLLFSPSAARTNPADIS